MNMNLFLTGGTGFLGTELASLLVRQPETALYVLVRAANKEEAIHRLRALWHHDPDLTASIGQSVHPLCGDFTKPGLGLSPDDLSMLRRITHVVHAGAEIGFQNDLEVLQKTNVEGTRNVLSFAAGLPALQQFIYISTAYVAGQRSGLIPEAEPASAFSSLYEKTKAEAEALVRASGLPFAICRPGMIVGHSITGRVKNFNTVYYILKEMLQGKMRILPIRRDTPLNLVPVDYVASSIVRLLSTEDNMWRGLTFHLTCPRAQAPTAGDLVEAVRTFAATLSLRLPRPLFLPLPFLRQLGLRYNRKESGRTKSRLNNLLTLLPYCFNEQEFDRTNTDLVLGPYSLKWQDYLPQLLSFACSRNFMQQTGRTVFEQAMVRRESRHYPITYYDIRKDGISSTSGPEVNRRIEKVRDSLYAWGIRKGDRVALTGINSVDYLVIEQAIGLIGAVSVPIYYTTPAAETETLLAKSGSTWFFVGDRRMFAQLEQVHTNARIVLFSVVQHEHLESAMSIDRFLEKTAPAAGPGPDPDDLATIRYTSGTTGEPKGVTFTFSQLEWMGTVLTNLVSWKDRNRPMRYLSFLPLSHVVEGILASYAPYYMLTDVGYYYLNDFGSLQASLPGVRPTIFFSVPRFYEKLWDQVMANPVGKTWMNARGFLKPLLGTLVRNVVLKKAGLDQCGQLIVGSAPVSETLLLHFRELGIEIHNAYGQTEAPLITINRLGDNVIPTIGTPLPETTVTAEPDGELIVRGPQVTPGYYGLQTENIRDGVLRTGDLGTIDAQGHITLFGRKKDFIITAYGKNISIPKLEQRLKDIPGVSEAVLIGENRPYCTALLWLEGTCPDLAQQIEQMNSQLSHPEQIRKYTVIPKPLSIQAGELTPNLKVKRANVTSHYAAEIEAMYA